MLKKARKKIIRLRKKGAIFYPIYDIVVSYKDNRNRGFIIEKLGFYNPHINKKIIYINSLRLSY
jgi:ribosomal protein S16